MKIHWVLELEFADSLDRGSTGVMRHALILMLFFGVAGCAGGSKILDDSTPIVIDKPITTASDERLQVSLQWLIVRNGPGSWAENADWDEYLLGISNPSGTDVQITNVYVIDSMDVRSAQGLDHDELIHASRAVAKRYKHDGLRVKAGMAGGTMAAMGAGTFVVGSAAAMYSMVSTVTLSSGAATAAATAGAGIVALPIMVVGGIVRTKNAEKLANEIRRRTSYLPRTLLAGEAVDLDVFFPLAPSPQRLEISYLVEGELKVLALDTHVFLDGLHLPDQVRRDHRY